MNLAEMLYQRGWQPVTGEQFLSWYSQRWPSHRAKRGLRFVEKRVHFNHRGKGVFLVIAHRIEGKLHHVNWVDESGALAGAKLELAFSPALLSGLAEGPGTHVDIDQTLVTKSFLKIYHCDPTRMEMARMVDISLPTGKAKAVRFLDPKGSWI